MSLCFNDLNLTFSLFNSAKCKVHPDQSKDENRTPFQWLKILLSNEEYF